MPGPIDAGFALDVQGVERLKLQARKDSESALKPAAQQFEALFINMMLKSMRDAVPKSGLLESHQMDTYQMMMDQQWSQSMAKAGGIGLADKLVDQMGESPKAPPAPSTVRSAYQGEAKFNN